MSSEQGQLPVVGGLGEVRESDDEVNTVVSSIKPELETKSGKKFDYLDAVLYRHQTVAGKNYFVKAKAKETDGPEQIVHLRIYKDLSDKLELTAYQLDKKLDDEILYMQ